MYSYSGDWQDLALCAQVDPELFFPQLNDRGAQAKEICAKCEVRLQCLQLAMTAEAKFNTKRYGIFGGLSPRDRKQLAKGLGRVA